MKKLTSIIENKEQWNELNIYIDLITENRKSNPNIALDGAKSIMETICKTILGNKGIAFNSCEKLGKLIKDTYNSLPFISYINSTDSNNARQILSSFETIAKNIGEFRNTHGAIAHGRDIQSTSFDLYLTELVIASSELVSQFLIMAHSEDLKDRDRIFYEDYPLFNNYLDEVSEEVPKAFGVEMLPSKFLFTDTVKYMEAMDEFIEIKEEMINNRLETYLLGSDDDFFDEFISFENHFSDAEIMKIILECMNFQTAVDINLLHFLNDLLLKNELILNKEFVKHAKQFLADNGV